MALLKKKEDPVSAREKALNSQIAALEEQIKRLDDQLQRSVSHPRLRSTAVPHGATISYHEPVIESQPTATVTNVPQVPVFEPVDQDRLDTRIETVPAPELYNDLGVRKYDLPGLMQRIRTFFQRPSTANPKLVSYLAAGGVQGLRPLRKEKRIARNRFIGLVALLFLTLLGIVMWFVRNR